MMNAHMSGQSGGFSNHSSGGAFSNRMINRISTKLATGGTQRLSNNLSNRNSDILSMQGGVGGIQD